MFRQDHLIETRNEVGIEESSMKDCEPEASANKLEVAQMIRIDARGGIDLERVIIMGGIFKETIAWIEDLVREKEEPFSAGG